MEQAFGSIGWILARTESLGTPGAGEIAAIAVPIHRIAEQLSVAVEQALRDHHLQRSAFEVLQSLLLAEGDLSPTDLHQALLVTSGGLTKILDRLQRAGLVHVRQDQQDKRRRLVSLTPAGAKTAREAERRVVEAERRVLGPALGNAQVRHLAAALRQLAQTLETSAAPSGSRRPNGHPRR